MPAITNINELQDIENDLAGTYWLVNDIDAIATAGWNGGAGFVPITLFEGQFNSKGYSITGLTINRPATNYVGLFSYILNDAIVQNAKLINANIIGAENVGVLAGYCLDSGIIQNCSSSGIVTAKGYVGGLIGTMRNSPILSCKSTTTVIANLRGTAGGLVGFLRNGAIVEESFAMGNVSSVWWGCGGLIGEIMYGSCIIRNSFARGAVSNTDNEGLGGLIGSTSGTHTIDDSYSTGQVSGIDPNIGGLIGYSNSVINNCFWDTQTSGQAASAGGTGKTTSQMKNKSTFTDAGWDFIVIWGINGVTNDGYPFFWASPPEPMPESPRTTVLVEDKITLESIRNVEMASRGTFRIDEEGKAVYRSRHARNP